MIYIIILILFMFVISLREGFVLRWELNGHQRLDSNIWHALGAIMRLFPLAITIWAMWPGWKEIVLASLIWANLAWTIYDMTINIVNGWPIFYKGKTSISEKLITNTLILIGKGLLFAVTIVYVLYYFNMIN